MAEKRLYVRIQNHDDFIDEAATAVAAWLSENAHFTGDVVVDKSMKIPNAAADAKEVGLSLDVIRAAIDRLNNQMSGLVVPDVPVDLEYDTETSQLSLVDEDGNVIGTPVTIVSGSGGITDIDLDYDEETGQLQLIDENGDTIGNPVTIVGGGGGGGAVGSKLTFSLPQGNTFTIMESATAAPIVYKFRSVDSDTQLPTGNGTLQVTVNNVVRANLSVQQGDANTVDVIQWLSSGANTVKLVMTDQYGATAQRTVTYYKERFELEWNLDETIKSTGALSVSITPYGSGTKTIYVLVDGAVHSTHTVTTTGRRFTVSLDLAIGAHEVVAYGEMQAGSTVVTSNTLTCAVAQTSDTSRTPVVSASLPVDEVTQYDNIVIPYRVIDPDNNPAEIVLLVNGAEYDTITVDQSQQTWSYRPSTAGSLTLRINCRSAYWTKTVTVKPLSADIEEVTDGLALKVDPNALTNLNAFTLSANFDTTNGGLQNDDENIRVIKVCRGDRLTVPYTPFGTDVRVNGADVKITYKVENSSDFDAEAITCWYGGIGFKLRANDVILASEQTTLQMDTCEGYKTELDMSIEKRSDSRLMSFWEAGIRSRTKIYGASDSFSQQTPSGIVIGSDDCDVLVYGIRCYTRDLTSSEVVTNFIADGKDATEIDARNTRNKIYDATGHIDLDALKQLAPKAHIVVIDAPKITGAKDDKVPSVIHHYWPIGGARHNWVTQCDHFAQGTSSLNYKVAGCNIDFKSSSFTLDDGMGETISAYAMSDNSIPVGYFNIKTDVASECHVNNMMGAQHYQDFQPSARAARTADPRVRDTIESHLAVILFRNTSESDVEMGPYTVASGELVFYGLGTFGNSKKSKEAFQYDDIVVEVDNNTSLQCRFKSDDLSTETWDGKANFEFRHLNEDVYTEDVAKGMFQQFLTWIVSCDHTQPTNTRLAQAVTYGDTTYTNDTAAYRRAKFKAEAANWLDLDSVMYHKIWTNLFSARDNRAKNMFLNYNTASGTWGLRFHYDSDTILGLNNEGNPDIRYGKMDTDSLGSGDVFNAADSNLFAMIDQCFMSEQLALATRLENAGAFNLEKFADDCDEVQSWIPEVLWNADADRKAIDVYKNKNDNSYIDMQIGKSKLQRRQFCTYHQPFMAGYYENPSVEANTATIRGYTPSSWGGVQPSSTVTVTTYTDLWLDYVSGSYRGKVRCTGGVPTTITLETDQMNDTENYFRTCHLIQSFGDLACLYSGYVDISKCSRLKEIIVGSSEAGYENSRFYFFNSANAKALEKINIEGCSAFQSELDLSNNLHVKEVYTRGSACSGVTFADNGRLRIAQLNAIKSIYAHGLKSIQTFNMVSYTGLTTINVVDSPALPVLQMMKGATNIQRVRLIDIDWDTDLTAYDPLIRAYNALGIDDDGFNVDHGVVTGSVHFDAIGNTKFNTLKARLTSVAFTRDETLSEVAVVFYNYDGVTELFRSLTEVGTGVEDPVTAGLISAPTRPRDAEYSWEYIGWDKNLSNITEATNVLAVFNPTARKYLVQYLSEGNVVESHEVPAHGSCEYEGRDLTKSGSIWTGWDDTADDVIEDMDINAVFEIPALPSQIQDLSQFDYMYSDDPADNAAYTFGQLVAILRYGDLDTYGVTNGQLIKMCPRKAVKNNVITDTELTFAVHARGHYELVGGGRSRVDFFMPNLMNATRQINTSNTNVGGFGASILHTWLNNALWEAMDPHWKELITQSYTLSNDGYQTTTATKTADYFRIPSYYELYGATSTVEVDSEANEIAFTRYTDNASRIKKGNNGKGAAAIYWTRTANTGSSSYFYFIQASGASYFNYNANYSYGVCLGFSVGTKAAA